MGLTVFHVVFMDIPHIQIELVLNHHLNAICFVLIIYFG